jgi:predicted RNA polymerase sigma factor
VTEVGTLLRDLAPAVLGIMVRRTGDFDGAEDAVQEALIAAAAQWPLEGVPANPTGWLVTVASRRRTETWRSEAARRRREDAVAAGPPPEPAPGVDDTLTLFLLCCHPALTRASQVALTLRAVGGLSTAEIARGLLMPEATVAQRISRAKARIRGQGFPPPDADRIAAVCAVLYLIFTEGHTASSGDALQRVSLTEEAIRLARQLHAAAPGDGEVTGLLALMLLTDARRAARTAPDGALVPLAAQDRSRWDRGLIAEGTALLTAALPAAPLGPYQLQAAIAAVHDESPTADATDWPQILALYDLLAAVAPGPMVTLNRLVALAMVRGPVAGLAGLDAAGPALAGHHRTAAVRAHLLERAGHREAAREHYRRAAELTLSGPERRYLLDRAGDTGPAAGTPPPRGG